MDFDIIIYLIILVATIISSVVAGKKKRNQQRVPYTAENKKAYTLSDTEKMMKNVMQKEAAKIKEAEQIKTQIEHENIKKQHEVVENKPYAEVQEKEQNKFDLKSAVIYSSILQRKKYKH